MKTKRSMKKWPKMGFLGPPGKWSPEGVKKGGPGGGPEGVEKWPFFDLFLIKFLY